MSDIALDRGLLLPDPFTEWYRERPFLIAFAASVLVHALLIAFVPGLRSVRIDTPPVLNVEIVMRDRPQPVTETPVPRPESRPETVSQPELAPPLPDVRPIERQAVPPDPQVEPVVTPPQPEVPVPAQRAELAPQMPRAAPLPEPLLSPRPDPMPEQRVEVPMETRATPQVERIVTPAPVARVEPRPEPLTLPRPDPRPEQRVEIPAEPKPVPQAQPIAVPAPLARNEPRPQPQAQPRIEPRPEPLPQPIAELAPPVQPVPQTVAPSAPQPRPVEPAVAAPPLPVPPLAPAMTVRTQPPVAAPVPPAPAVDGPVTRELMATFSQQISGRIKREQRYPAYAVTRRWQGTAEVLLRISADGQVTEITLGRSTGREILDREALEMVRRASPLPMAPPQLRGRELSVTVPIVFRLQDS